MTAVDEIKSRLDIVEVVSQSVKLRKTGKNYTGFCPFHPNTRTPAFSVFPDTGTWRCFGACNEGGDIFKFVMKKEGWDFPTTLKVLAEKAGVRLEPPTPERVAQEEEHTRLRALLEDAVTFYRHALIQAPSGKPALDYLVKRGLTQTSIETFGLGYAPTGWDTAMQHFISKGFTNEELLQAGLIVEKDSGGYRDKFHNRILFPIRDALGKMCGFGGRVLDPNDIPKFLNSPQTTLFDKGRLLYGLDQARKTIRMQEQAVIVEGYLDVIALHQCGFANTISPMGTALTEDQLRLLKRFTRRIVLALDADAAGEKATLRGLELARQAMDHGEELVFDARGLLRHEARLQADVRVTTLPPGKDPDEVALSDPGEWEAIVQNARPIVVHVMQTLAASRNLEDAKEKREVAREVLPLIADIPDPVERDAYRQQLARLLKVDERTLTSTPTRETVRRRKPIQSPNEEQPKPEVAEQLTGPQQLVLAMEKHILQILYPQPETIYDLDRSLHKLELGSFSVDDFSHIQYRSLADLLLHALDQQEKDVQDYLAEQLPSELTDVVSSLKEERPTSTRKDVFHDQKVFEDLVRTMIQLRRKKINQEIDQLRFLQEETKQAGSDGFNMYQEIILKYYQSRNRLDRALVKPFQRE
jgi:DNA primase